MTLAITLTKVIVDMDKKQQREVLSDPMTGFKEPIRRAQTDAIFSLTEPAVCAVRPVDKIVWNKEDDFYLSDSFVDSLTAFFHKRFNIVNGEDEVNDVLLGLTNHLTTGIYSVYQSLDDATEEDARFISRIFDLREECQKHNADHPDDIMLPAVELCW